VCREISLLEALTGTAFELPHLDGRVLKISSAPGAVIRAESEDGYPYMMHVPNEGMPLRTNPGARGALYITFKVLFPTSISTASTALLREALAGSEPVPRNPGQTDPLAAAGAAARTTTDCALTALEDEAVFGRSGAEDSADHDAEGDMADDGAGQCRQA